MIIAVKDSQSEFGACFASQSASTALAITTKPMSVTSIESTATIPITDTIPTTTERTPVTIAPVRSIQSTVYITRTTTATTTIAANLE